MKEQTRNYRALFSSDWSECLSPNGPFDPIAFNYPGLRIELAAIFREYTGNVISLTQATDRIRKLLPNAVTVEQMDIYLERSFRTYRGVPEFIQWCLDHDVLFMLNTTGSQGYFQRAFAKGLLPPVPVVAANPLIQFPEHQDEKRCCCTVLEIDDKARCTESVMRQFSVQPSRVILMGDSGGDGPHFKWGAEVGAFLIGSMAKQSLESYCKRAGLVIDYRFGLSYGPNEPRDPAREMEADFIQLVEIVEELLSRSR